MAAVEPIIVVLGPRCGGTSAVAGVLRHLGVFMGDHFSWSLRELSENWEDVFLAQILARAYFGKESDRLQVEPAFFREKLHNWADGHRGAARSSGHRPGVKHPLLCTAVEFVRDAWGPIMPVLVDRPVDKVVASLVRLGWFPNEQQASASTTRLIAARDQALADGFSVRVDFEELRADPDAAIRRLAGELELQASDEQVQAAVKSVVLPADGSDPSGAEGLVAKLQRDPDDARSMFLLGETLFQMGDIAAARKVFAKRVEMAGWDQERYFAMFRVAELTAKLGEPWPAVENAYLWAWELAPASGEPLFPIGYQYFQDNRLRLAHLFAKFAGEMPVPERSMAALGGDHTVAAADLQAMCEFKLGKPVEAFDRWRRLLARPDLPDDMRRIITVNRNMAVPAMLGAALSYPAAVLGALVAGAHDCEVTVSLTAGPDPRVTAATLNSFLNCCTDIARVGRFLVVDAGLSTKDRELLEERYGFAEFVDADSATGSGALLDSVRDHVGGRFWLHLGDGWQFFAPEKLITRLAAVLEAEPQVFQVSINLADAAGISDGYVPAIAVRRAPDTGRYALADTIAAGPAMFDTSRLDRPGGIDGAASAGLRTASLDEVLCLHTSQ